MLQVHRLHHTFHYICIRLLDITPSEPVLPRNLDGTEVRNSNISQARRPCACGKEKHVAGDYGPEILQRELTVGSPQSWGQL